MESYMMENLKDITTDSLVFKPSAEFADKANLNQAQYEELKLKANEDYLSFWGDLALDKITWEKKFSQILNEDNAPFYKWFEDGLLNVSYNCLDRHLAKNGNKTAIIFVADDGKEIKISYAELHKKVCQFANGLKSLEVKSGDRVIIYLPQSIEAVIAMQACARIGAIHSVVFAGFSAKSLSERILDARAEIVITADGGIRGGKISYLKAVVDEALERLEKNSPVRTVIVERRIDIECSWNHRRDVWWEHLIKEQMDTCLPNIIPSEHPLFILYTSGSTGAPKGVQHSSAGYLLGTILTMEWVFDIKSNDIFWCTADVGWITGHSYVCYGPLAIGATQIIFEGTPMYPDASRFWQIIEKYRATIFYTAPTAIRALIKSGSHLPNQFDLSTLRLLGSVGEPISPETWLWFYEVVGKKRCPIVDTWWQTETGCNMLAPIPGVTALKPGSCTFPLPGIMADIVDDNGDSIAEINSKGKNHSHGYLVIKKPFPSQIRTIWSARERFIKSYFPKEIANGKYYVAGDSANKDKDGYFWILGRIDDVLNVSGHRLGTMEIESALVSHSKVAEAAVVGKPHPIKGEAIYAFVVCKSVHVPKGGNAKLLINELQEWVSNEIGAIAKPDEIHFTESLPKTRSGKIMRRLLRNIVLGEEITGDISTLENPAILEQLKNKH